MCPGAPECQKGAWDNLELKSQGCELPDLSAVPRFIYKSSQCSEPLSCLPKPLRMILEV